MAIEKVGDYEDFAYKGSIDSFLVPFDGLYKLEVWGGKGGGTYGGKGGYSVGYKEFKAGTEIFVCCGGGNNVTYNGGGSCKSTSRAGHGGGATHMALVTGLLSAIGKTSFVNNQNGLIVAGGGGGQAEGNVSGGTGGGTKGNTGGGAYGGGGGTQTAGGTGGGGYGAAGGFGKGGAAENSTTASIGGGGAGGFYGGGGGGQSGGGAQGAGGGGSGWIGGVPEVVFKGVTYTPTMSNGQNGERGKAKITLIAKAFPSVLWNGIVLEGARHDIVNAQGQVISSTEIDAITFDGKPIE